jgi:hypothetical protein
VSAIAQIAAHPTGRGVLARLLSLSPSQARFQTRGFAGSDPETQLALENIGQTFIGGYNSALAARDVDAVLDYVGTIPAAERGFATEGAVMGAAVIDALPFRRPLLPTCIAAFRSDFTYLAHVGAGWSLARVPWRRRSVLATLDPIHRWLAFDGLGFHDAYFYHRRVLAGWRRERKGYAAHAYDQGVGRALWFVAGGSAASATGMISVFTTARRSDLWSGLGLAMAYAGPVSSGEIVETFQAAGANGAGFAQGVAFACEARVLARHVPTHTDLTARAVWGVGAEHLSGLVREARGRLAEQDDELPRYEIWRRSVADAFLQTTERYK